MKRREWLAKLAQAAALLGAGAAGFWFARRHPGAAAAPGAAAGPRRSLGPEFVYDVSAFTKVDPALRHYRQSQCWPVPLQEPHALASGPDGRIYLAGDRRILTLSAQGETIHELVLDGVPRALCLAGETLYVAVTDHLELFSVQSERRAAWPRVAEAAMLTGIAVTADRVFLADAAGRIVWCCDGQGRVLGRIGARDPERQIPGFAVPSPFFALAAGPDGLLYATNPGRHRLEAYTAAGDLEWSWGETGIGIESFCGCCNPVSFAMFPDGRFVTAEKGLPRVKVYDRRGHFESVVAGPEDFAENRAACTAPAGPGPSCQYDGLAVAIESDAAILVLDLAARNLRRYRRHEEA